MIDRLSIPKEVRNIYDDVPSNAIEDVGVSINWLRQKIRSTARDDAVIQASGLPNNLHPEPMPPYAETMLLAHEITNRLGWSSSIAIAAMTAEWRDAQEDVRKTEEDVRRVVWPMAKIRSPGHEIIAAAQRACDRSGVFIPTEILTDLCRRIAQATVPKNARKK